MHIVVFFLSFFNQNQSSVMCSTSCPKFDWQWPLLFKLALHEGHTHAELPCPQIISVSLTLHILM